MDSDKYILGICGTFHDSAAALLRGGRIIAALEEERITRAKHDGSPFPTNAVANLLRSAGIKWDDVTDIGFAWDYGLYRADGEGRGDRFFRAMHAEYAARMGSSETPIPCRDVYERNRRRYNKTAVRSFIERMQREASSSHSPSLHFVRHHLAHAASAYYGSGFKEPALAVTFDGYGDLETSTIWRCQGTAITPISSTPIPHSLGWVYAAITEYLGFRPLFSEGEVMGLAPYGRPRSASERVLAQRLSEFMRRIVRTIDNGGFEVEESFLYFGCFGKYGERLSEAAGQLLEPLVPRTPIDEYPIDPDRDRDRPRAVLAWALQQRLEEVVCHVIAHYLRSNATTRGIESVVLAGGIAQNIKVNSRLVRTGLVGMQKLFVCPVAGDAGAALGAAMVVGQQTYGCDPRQSLNRVDLGPSYDDAQLRAALAAAGLENGRDYDELENGHEIVRRVGHLLLRNRVVAWYQGRSEFGARALGHRSILLNAQDPAADRKANLAKRRQHWRPTALSLTIEDASSYLAGLPKTPLVVSMTLALDVSGPRASDIKAGRHRGDSTTRPQTVSPADNELFWDLIRYIGKEGGVPAVVNTSFNCDEPIVESPEEAVNTFYYMDEVDYLMLDRFLIHSKQNLFPTIRAVTRELERVNLGDGFDLENLELLIADTKPRSSERTIDADYLGTGAVLRLPLLKEFFDPRNGLLRQFIARRIYAAALRLGPSKVRISVTSPKYSRVVYGILQEELLKIPSAGSDFDSVYIDCGEVRCLFEFGKS